VGAGDLTTLVAEGVERGHKVATAEAGRFLLADARDMVGDGEYVAVAERERVFLRGVDGERRGTVWELKTPDHTLVL
jgi:hypothetical protein